jgi:DNA replicative helicase MCM subunit Mcm2 (Cdc46/Mcm family)
MLPLRLPLLSLSRKAWSLVREESVFVDWQRVKVQENPEEVPAGSLPRTLDVIVRNKQVRLGRSGCTVVLTQQLRAHGCDGLGGWGGLGWWLAPSNAAPAA